MQRTDEIVRHQVPRGSETLLLVEDDKTLQALAVRVLRNYGYSVLAADNGQQALAIACDPKTHIDALITDVVMPGINGRELVEKILRIHPLMPCLLMSGYADDDILRRGISQGERAFLQKPFTPEQLAQQVRLLLDMTQSAVA
jgi:CheY-like chemotaxis protein